MKTCECKCTGFVDNPQAKRGRANPSMHKNSVSDELINKLNWGRSAKAKQIVGKPSHN